MGRFLSHEEVTPESIFAAAGEKTGGLVAGRHVLAIQDTTCLSFSRRTVGREGFGPGGDGSVAGLFLHPVIVLDAAEGNLLGLAAGRVWSRAPEKVSSRRGRPLEEKESARWIEEGLLARERLREASSVTLIADREGDIFEAFARLPGERCHLIVRAGQDRALEEGGSLFAAPKSWNSAGQREIALPARSGRAARTAVTELRFGEVTLRRPAHGEKNGPESLRLVLVEVRETRPPKDCDAVHWRLLTTHAVTTAEEGWRIADWYRRRWRIEEYFRTLKKSGLDLEAAMIEQARSLENLVAMAAVAGVVVMRMVEGREAPARHRATDIVEVQDLPCLKALCLSLEGKTQKQKNPHAEGSLAWLAWIIGRLGGWSGYKSYSPPGPKTMATGWQSFNAIRLGWSLNAKGPKLV